MGLCTGAGYIKPKVRDKFCDECKHYKKSTMYEGNMLKDKCFQPKVFNREKYKNSTPTSKGFIHKWTYPGDCYFMNKNNNCKYYEEK